MGRPHFGKIITTLNGMQMECKAIAPGLSLPDLVRVFEQASAEAKPEDAFAADPTRWPVTRGVHAVAEAILSKLYDGAEPPPMSHSVQTVSNADWE